MTICDNVKCAQHTCSEIDEQVQQENCVRHAVKDHPSCAVVVVEKRYCYRQDD